MTVKLGLVIARKLVVQLHSYPMVAKLAVRLCQFYSVMTTSTDWRYHRLFYGTVSRRQFVFPQWLDILMILLCALPHSVSEKLSFFGSFH